MIKFFRKIRYDLIEHNKKGKYFKYAFGEIILVVIGILIALQINNWNTIRLEKNNIANYYERIVTELDGEIQYALYRKISLDSLIYKHKRALKIIDSKNVDSLDVLKSLLGATATTWDVDYQFPITKDFISQNYLSKIDNDSIKWGFQELAWLFDYSERNRDYNSTQYVNTIEPFFIKNINYSEVALPSYREVLISGGPKVNYATLFTNLELWNIITFKLESLTGESTTLDYSIKNFERIKKCLENELEN